MAYIKNQNQKQGPISTSGQSSVISANTTDPNVSDAQGTGWTDLKKYLDNNNGLGAGVGQAVTADSQGKIDSAAGKINEFQTKAVAANQSGVAQNKSLDAYKTQIATDPTKVNSTAYKNDTSAAYKGLTDAQSADGYTDAYNAYGGAKSGYDNLKSDDWANRSQAVSDTYGKNNAGYTKGMGMLDTFILQGDQSGKDQIKSYVDKNSGTFAADGKDALSSAKAGVQSSLDSEKNRWASLLGDKSTEGSINKAIADKRGALDTQVKNSTYDAYDNARLKAENDIKQKFTEAGQDVPDSALDYYSIDGDSYLSGNDAAVYNALSNLDGSAQVNAKGLNTNIDWQSVLGDIDAQKKKVATEKSRVDAFNTVDPRDTHGKIR